MTSVIVRGLQGLGLAALAQSGLKKPLSAARSRRPDIWRQHLLKASCNLHALRAFIAEAVRPSRHRRVHAIRSSTLNLRRSLFIEH